MAKSASEIITSYHVLQEAMDKVKDTTTIIILTEYKDGTSNLAYSQMPPRDLWWQLTNACMRVWNMIGGV